MYNIIICDDDRAFVDYIKGVMAKSGMDKGEILFSEYYSGEELVQGIRNRNRCDLLILDMQMEGLDGHETAARFREVGPVFWSSFTGVSFYSAQVYTCPRMSRLKRHRFVICLKVILRNG